MPKYMINICYGDLDKRSQSKNPKDTELLMQKYGEWSQKIGKKTIVAHKLRDGSGRKLTYENGKVQDGPFVETKETIGGFYIVDAKNYEEAIKIASECPTLLYQGGYVEVREVEM